MRTPSILALGAIVLLGTIGACSDPGTGPGPIAGRYTLRLIDGHPVPALLGHTASVDADADEYVDGAYLVVADPGVETLSVSRRIVVTPTGGSASTLQSVEKTILGWDGDHMCASDAAGYYDLPPECPSAPRVKRHGDTVFLDLRASTPLIAVPYAFVREGR